MSRIVSWIDDFDKKFYFDGKKREEERKKDLTSAFQFLHFVNLVGVFFFKRVKGCTKGQFATRLTTLIY